MIIHFFFISLEKQKGWVLWIGLHCLKVVLCKSDFRMLDVWLALVHLIELVEGWRICVFVLVTCMFWVEMALNVTYDSNGNQVHHSYLTDNRYDHCNDIAYQYMVHFHIGTYSKGTLCQLLPHLFVFITLHDFKWLRFCFLFIFKCKIVWDKNVWLEWMINEWMNIQM